MSNIQYRRKIEGRVCVCMWRGVIGKCECVCAEGCYWRVGLYVDGWVCVCAIGECVCVCTCALRFSGVPKIVTDL